MKYLILLAFLVLFSGFQSLEAQKLERVEQVRRELSYSSDDVTNSLVLQNINGSVIIEGYDGETLQLNAEKIIMANNPEDLESGINDIQIKVDVKDHKIVIHPSGTCINYIDNTLSNDNCKVSVPYEFIINFTVKVPRNIDVYVGTISDGKVQVKDTRGDFIKANNTNGNIVLNNIMGQTEVSSVNGDVEILYNSNPNGPSRYYSLNGDIKISYQKNLSANLIFKSSNGELFTDFNIERQYAKISRMESNKEKKGKYRYESRPLIQIGAPGDLVHNFETSNGNVIIKKI